MSVATSLARPSPTTDLDKAAADLTTFAQRPIAQPIRLGDLATS